MTRCLVYTECLSTGNKIFLRKIEDAHQISNSPDLDLKNDDTVINDNRIQCLGVLTSKKTDDIPSIFSFNIFNKTPKLINRYGYNTYITINM